MGYGHGKTRAKERKESNIVLGHRRKVLQSRITEGRRKGKKRTQRWRNSVELRDSHMAVF